MANTGTLNDPVGRPVRGRRTSTNTVRGHGSQGVVVDPNQRQSRNMMRSSLVQFRRQRRFFIIKVYFLALIFIGLSAAQWVHIIMTDEFVDFFEENPFIPYLASFCALLFLTVFAFFDEVRFSAPYNCTIGLLIVECATFSILPAIMEIAQQQLTMSFLITGGFLLFFTIVGILSSRDFTLDIAVLSILSSLFYLIACVVLLVVITFDIFLPAMALIGAIVSFLAVYIMYNAQLIVGRRTGIIRWTDYVLGALLVYFTFTTMFTMTAFVTNLLEHNEKFEDFIEGILPDL